MKKIEDYLHLYLGCTLKSETGTVILMSVIAEIPPCTNWGIAVLNGNQSYTTGIRGYKPILRPLSDMTEEEMVELFNIGRGVHSDNKVDEVKRTASNEYYLRTGLGEYLFGWREGHDNDVRVPVGYTFYIKRFYISEDLSVTGGNITTSPSHFNPIKDDDKTVSCGNQTEIFRYLLSKHFDLFGLIESGLAITKPTTP